MGRYRIESPDGRFMVVEGDVPPTQDDADALFKQPAPQKVGIDNQSALPKIDPRLVLPTQFAGLGSHDHAFAGQGQSGLMKPTVGVELLKNPQGFGEGMLNSVAKGLAGLTSPMGVATLPLTAVKPLQIPLMGLFAGLGAQGVGQGLGHIAGTPDMTQAQKGEAYGDVAQSALQMLPALAHTIPFTPKKVAPVVPEHMAANPQRPLTVDEINARAGLTPRSSAVPSTVVPSKAPAIQTQVGEPSFFDKGVDVSKAVVKEPKVEPLVAKVEAPVVKPVLTPALLVDGKPITGGATHADILNTIVQKAKATKDKDLLSNAIDAHADDSKHVFVDQAGKIYNRQEGAAALGLKGDLHSQDLPKVQPAVPVKVTFKPAVKVGDTILPVEGHQAAPALRLSLANPGKRLIRGFLGSDGVFYDNPMAVARKQMEQQSTQQPIGVTQDANIQRTQQQAVRPENGKEQEGAASATQGQVEKEIPLDVGQGSGRTPRSNQRGDEGLLSQVGKEKVVLQGEKPQWVKNIEAIDPRNRNEHQNELLGKWQAGESPSVPKPRLSAKPLSDEGGWINGQILTELVDKVRDGADALKTLVSNESITSKMNFLRGKDVPRTLAASKDVANNLYKYAQSSAVADVLAKHEPTDVLGGDESLDKKLGNVLVEYNLRALGQTSVGKKWSFATDKDYQDALNDPKVQAAIQRHNDIVLEPATERHTTLGGKEITLPDQRMFVNLKYIPKVEATSPARGNIKALLQKKTQFNRERTGTADEYETSYRKIAERMIRSNYSEFNRSKLNDSYVANGLGKWVKPGDTVPEGHVEIPTKIQRAIITPEGEGQPTVVNQNRSLYVRKDLAPEYLQAMQSNTSMSAGLLRGIGDVMTRVQVQLGVDAIQHTINMASAVNGAVRSSLGKNIVGVKEIDTIERITKNLFARWNETPEYRALVTDMAKHYGIAREEQSYKGLFGKESVGGKWIRTVDEAGRVTLFQLARQLQDEGYVKPGVEEVRRFVNTQLGQYNKRLMNPLTAAAKATFSPFVVAGKTFNRLGATRLLLSPQMKAANPKAWAEMRARQAIYVGSALVIIPAILNYEINGNVLPDDTKLGEIKLPNGNTFDMAKWTLIRRGLRITGAETMLDQQVLPRLRGEQPAAIGQSARQSFTDVARGVAGPYAGPLPNAIAATLTGKTALGYETRQPGEQYPYGKAAIRQLNPLLGAGMTDQPGSTYKKKVESLAGVGEPKETTIVSNLRRQFLYKQGKAKDATFPPSEYDMLKQTLMQGDVEGAKKAYDSLYQEKLAQHKNDKDPVRETQMDFQKYFERFAKAHGSASKEDEEVFVKQLTPHQKDLYDKAQKQQSDATALFFTIQPKLGKKSSLGSFDWP